MQLAIGIDFGGTNLKYGLVDRRGEVLVARTIPSQADEGRAGVRDVLERAVRDLREFARWKGHQIVAAGLGLPGTVSGRRGTVLTAPPQIPGIQGFEAATCLRELAGVKAAADNDATVAVLAEARVGAGRDAATVLLATVGTGVGGGLVLGGQLVRGRYGTGGEIGHGVFMPHGLVCGHGGGGGRGCFELYASATALGRIFVEAGGPAGLSPRAIVDMAEAGDPTALGAIEQLGTNLGIGLATAAALVAPDVIVIGGGLAEAGRLLLDPIKLAFRTQSLPYVAKGAKIVRAKLKNKAGIVGAALLAFEEGL